MTELERQILTMALKKGAIKELATDNKKLRLMVKYLCGKLYGNCNLSSEQWHNAAIEYAKIKLDSGARVPLFE